MALSSQNRQLVYDEIRSLWLKATPEENVRQRWIQTMIHQLQYPRELFVVEKNLRELPGSMTMDVPDRRIDILVFGKGIDSPDLLSPWLLIECKAGPLTQAAKDQVVGYNYYVRARCIAVVNLESVQFGVFDEKEKQYIFYPVLPSYLEITQWIASKCSLMNPIH